MTSSSLFHGDTILFDKRKQRVGVVQKLTGQPKYKQITIQWSTGDVDLIDSHPDNLKILKHYKVIRLRDFPVILPHRGYGGQMPVRIRKDEFLLDNGVCKFTRLLDVIAVYPLVQNYVLDNLIDFLPEPETSIALGNHGNVRFKNLFEDSCAEDFIVEVCLDRTNQSIYRIRISTSVLLPKTN